jgi:hypothetical protein
MGQTERSMPEDILWRQRKRDPWEAEREKSGWYKVTPLLCVNPMRNPPAMPGD